MKLNELSESELLEAGVCSLSNRPTAPYAWGGEGLTPRALKERFDRLPRLVAERLNTLIRMLGETPDLADPSDASIAEAIRSGLHGEEDGHSLADFFRDLTSGAVAAYLRVGERSLAEALSEKETASRILSAVGEGELSPESGDELRLGELGDLLLHLPDAPSSDFAVALSFDTKAASGGSSLVITHAVKWSGDDVAGGYFLPLAARHYTCLIWFDGAYQGIVRSVPR
jgi:hypothetical protein